MLQRARRHCILLAFIVLCSNVAVCGEQAGKGFEMPPVEAFISKWAQSGGSELGSAQSFLVELCDLLGVARPDSPRPTVSENIYVFERQVTFNNPDGTTSSGRIDLYKKGCFILEAKQGSDQKPQTNPLSQAEMKRESARRRGTAVRGTHRWDDAMMKARAQAEGYARALPPEEGRPPFLLVVDVGYSIECFAEFSQSGGVYTPFPSARENRIFLEDLRRDDVRERLRRIWADPLSLDPSRVSERVTNDIAIRLGRLAKSLEDSGHDPELVSMFLMRCIFTMFAEDVDLLPYDSFTHMLSQLEEAPENFAHAATDLWRAMKKGGFSSFLMKKVLRFNGHLFEDATALPLNRDQLDLLLEASKANWSEVETSIFGTLLERALSPKERHKLGAHYTPRAYVERLVIPTIIEPLREEWDTVKAVALNYVRKGDHKSALKEIQDFHKRLCEIIILDPACGSGNFLFVSLDLLKDLEGEVVAAMRDLGKRGFAFEGQGYAVGPHQFKGIEFNPRAAAISELVLWLSYLQRHYKVYGRINPPEPILKDYKSIECRDAVLAWDRIEEVTDESGKVVKRWDGETYVRNPDTGRDIPDETALVSTHRFVNPRPASPWPRADFIVGNPPFIGNKRMRTALGDGYVDALRAVYPDVPGSVDYVMYWWQRAALLAQQHKIKRFGFITTNSIRQTYNRKILDAFLDGDPPLSILKAVPDHPWVDSSNGAQVRISMTVVASGHEQGIVSNVILERPADGYVAVSVDNLIGRINSNLTIGIDAGSLKPLQANEGLCSRGMIILGPGFIVTPDTAKDLGLGRIPGLEKHIRPYLNGRDLSGKTRNLMVIDLFGLSIEEVQHRYPDVYQWVVERVKPDRDQKKDGVMRTKWWLHGRVRSEFRPALVGLTRYIATVETARRRYFVFLPSEVLPDDKLVIFASDDAYVLGVLSSRIHIAWSLASCAKLGAGNDPVYVKSACFDTFPFPDATAKQKQRIREIAERLDSLRKTRQEAFPELTLTNMYAVLEKIRYGVHLTNQEESIRTQGQLDTLMAIHDELDQAVAESFGIPSTISTEAILERLVELHNKRWVDEQLGDIHWLRPDYQASESGVQGRLHLEDYINDNAGQSLRTKDTLQSWPKTMPEQVKAVRGVLPECGHTFSSESVAKKFKGAKRQTVMDILHTLEALGHIRAMDDDVFSLYP